jgi:light-regulated signal transduction histidine kinase (bacteriophytochrome)
MEELQERFQLEANTIGIILKSEYGSPKVSANFDREKIQRVLANLLDNALKFTPVGGEIELGFTQNKNEIIFWVSDTGPGIPIDFHQKIFERYIQFTEIAPFTCRPLNNHLKIHIWTEQARYDTITSCETIAARRLFWRIQHQQKSELDRMPNDGPAIRYGGLAPGPISSVLV